MTNYNIYVLRHAYPDWPNKSLGDNGTKKSNEKWVEILNLWVTWNIQIITSSIQRAIQTWEWIAKWLWVTWEIITLNNLTEEWNTFKAVQEINPLIKENTIIVTHWPKVRSITEFLWWPHDASKDPNYLTWSTFITNIVRLKTYLLLIEQSQKWLIDYFFDINILLDLIKWWASKLENVPQYRIDKLLELWLINEKNWVYEFNLPLE